MRNTIVLTAAAGTAVYILVGLPAQAEAAPGSLRLMTGSSQIVLDKYKNNPVTLNLGAHLAADKAPFEVRLNRKSYKDPIVATQIIRDGGKETVKKLPAGLVKDFRGFPGMLRMTLTNAKGKKVVDRVDSFCPNSFEGGRIRQDAPATATYPGDCPENPFTLGSVWGIDGGWAVSTSSDRENRSAKLAVGKYTAKIWVTKRYRDAFGIKNDVKTVKVTVRASKEPQKAPVPARPKGHGHHGSGSVEGRGDRLTEAQKKVLPKPNAARPAGALRVPEGPKPDLRSLPAFGIEIQKLRPKPGAPKRDYLAFGANVWNAGQSPLVVDGFLRQGKRFMDGYQYFYDGNGKQVGHAKTGTFQWDARRGHLHWHFLDFAGYSLLNSSQKQIVRSQKEAFCLANTDAVDYTIPLSKWRPGNNDLSTSCGYQGSLSLRQVLDIGSGDTYTQDLPGQSFDITKLKNGTYYIKVAANPVGKLYESNTKNNVALRKVILSGKRGARKVTVPPVGQINAK